MTAAPGSGAGTAEPLTIDELARHVALPVRTIREYHTMRLLPSPERRGRVGCTAPGMSSAWSSSPACSAGVIEVLAGDLSVASTLADRLGAALAERAEASGDSRLLAALDSARVGAVTDSAGIVHRRGSERGGPG
jgi:hypothetical protein